MKYNFCKNCGSPVQPGLTNCQRCGAPVDQVQPVDEDKPMAQPPGMLKQYYDPEGNMQQPSNMQQPANNFQQPMGNPNPQQPVNNYQQPMGQPMNNNFQQPMGNPNPQQQVNNYQQPMGQPMGNNNYGQPMPQQVQQPQNKGGGAMGSAIGSVACGIIAFFIFWWLSICGIGIGFTAIKTGKAQNNNGAFIIGIIGVLLCIADIVLYLLAQNGIFVINL